MDFDFSNNWLLLAGAGLIAAQVQLTMFRFTYGLLREDSTQPDTGEGILAFTLWPIIVLLGGVIAIAQRMASCKKTLSFKLGQKLSRKLSR